MSDTAVSIKDEFFCFCGWNCFFSQLSPVKRVRDNVPQWDFLCPNCNEALVYGSPALGFYAREGLIVRHNLS